MDDAPLGPPREPRVRCSAIAAAAHEDRVGAAAVGLDEVGPRSATRAPQRQQRSCASQRRRAARAPPRARERRRPPRRHLLQQRDVPLPAGQRARELVEQRRARPAAPRGRGRGSRSGRASRRRTLPGLTRHFLTGERARPATSCRAARPRARAQGARRAPRARSTAGPSRCSSRSRRRARALSFEAGVFELGGHPMVLRPDELQLTRGESIARHRAASSRATSRRSACAPARRASSRSSPSTRPSRWSTCSPPSTTRARRSPTC